MDRVDNFILRNMHKTNNLKLVNKTWQDFKVECKNKKLILYGLGPLLIYFPMRCSSDTIITAVIDNDVNKQNLFLNDFFDISDFKESINVKISSKEILKNYNPDEVVLLISPSRFYEKIADELDAVGFHCYFNILNLEYNYREQMKKQKIEYETEETYMKNYAMECIKKYSVQNNKLVFSSNVYIDHGKYITEKLLEMNKNLDIVWIVNNPKIDVPRGVRIVLENNLKKYIYEMETAKTWIYGVLIKTAFFIKRKEQIYIQTKHWGSVTLKTFSLANLKNINVENYKLNGEWMDYIISGSEFDEETCKKAFNFKGTFLRFGSPRSDVLFYPEKCRKKINKIFDLSFEDKILIYAPTYRIYNTEKYFFDFKWQNLDFKALIDLLNDKWSCKGNGKWKIFLRLHPWVKISSNQIKPSVDVIDVSYYEDSQELVAASDIMISDYSSIMFEFAYVMKPVFLYAPDKSTYEINDQAFFLQYDSLPFPISTTNEELADKILNFDEVEYKQNVQAFLDKYGVHEDGHASERTAKFIVKLLGE